MILIILIMQAAIFIWNIPTSETILDKINGFPARIAQFQPQGITRIFSISYEI